MNPRLGGLREVASLVTLQGGQRVGKQRQEERAGLGSLEEFCLLLGSFSVSCPEEERSEQVTEWSDPCLLQAVIEQLPPRPLPLLGHSTERQRAELGPASES